MFENDVQIRLHESPWTRSIEMAIVHGVRAKRLSVAQPLIMKTLEEGELITPAASLDKEGAQTLFNELWRMGFRPSDGTGNSGHIAALSYHLEDMRKLVFKGKP